MSDDVIIAELRSLRASVERLCDDIEALAVRGRLGREDREMLAELYASAAPVFGAKVFTTSDVFAWPTLAPLVAGYTASTLSWLLSRAERVTLAGYRIERVGTDRGGALWQLRVQAVTPAPASARNCVPMVKR